MEGSRTILRDFPSSSMLSPTTRLRCPGYARTAHAQALRRALPVRLRCMRLYWIGGLTGRRLGYWKIYGIGGSSLFGTNSFNKAPQGPYGRNVEQWENRVWLKGTTWIQVTLLGPFISPAGKNIRGGMVRIERQIREMLRNGCYETLL